jgi:hypothetical protein
VGWGEKNKNNWPRRCDLPRRRRVAGTTATGTHPVSCLDRRDRDRHFRRARQRLVELAHDGVRPHGVAGG